METQISKIPADQDEFEKSDANSEHRMTKLRHGKGMEQFNNDQDELMKQLRLIALEPFIHDTDEQVDKLPIDRIDKLAKYYFNEWIKTLDENKLMFGDVDTLRTDLVEYAKAKNIEVKPDKNE